LGPAITASTELADNVSWKKLAIYVSDKEKD
jgi:hypothetical protein